MKVYYFTRTGNCERIAQAIAKQKHTTAYKIDDGQDWSGPLRFIKGGAMAAKQQTYELLYEPLENDEEIILVFPIWASTFPPAIRSFLQEVNPKRIQAVVVSKATSLSIEQQSIFRSVVESKGRNPSVPKLK